MKGTDASAESRRTNPLTSRSGTPGGASAPSGEEALELDDRAWMLWQVHRTCIEGRLDRSLELSLPVAQRQAPALELEGERWRLAVPIADVTSGVPGSDTRTLLAFDEHGGDLVILGPPGSGKTAQLLLLTEALLARAHEHPEQPIPVVLELASWVACQLPLDQWMPGQIERTYGLDEQLGRSWILDGAMLPLLDGLDEMPSPAREDCLDAIGRLREQNRGRGLVLCALPSSQEVAEHGLGIRGAVACQPLPRAAILRYLLAQGPAFEGLLQTLRYQPRLWKVLESPLLLGAAARAFEGTPERTLTEILGRSHMDEGALRARVWSAYVTRALSTVRSAADDTPEHGRPVRPRYPVDASRRWLVWLAWSTARRQLSTIHVERLQVSWLTDPVTRSVATSIPVTIIWCVGYLSSRIVWWWLGLWYGSASPLPQAGLIAVGACWGIGGLIAGLTPVTEPARSRWPLARWLGPANDSHGEHPMPNAGIHRSMSRG